MCCQRRHQAPNTERLKSQQMPSSAITDSGMCWQKRLEAPETTWPKSQQVATSAIADSGKCWQKSLEAPDTTKLCNLQPSSASAGLGNVQVERPRKKKCAKAATSVPICFQGNSMVNHRGEGFCLAVTKGRAHKYSSDAVYPSCAQAPSVVASMGQIGHDSQEGCQALAELNRYLCHLATQELRVSFDRRPDMQLERPRNLQLHTPQHLDLCGHGTNFARLSEGCQALAELNRYHRRLARHELLGMRGCSTVKVQVQVQVQVQEGVVEEWRPVRAIQVTPFGVIECVETPLLPPACQSHPGDSRWSQQGLDTRARPLPCRREWVSRPRSSASASLMGKGKRSRAALFPKARPVPRRWGNMKARPLPRRHGKVSDPKGSAIALPMGKGKRSRAALVPKARPVPRRWGRSPKLVLTMKVRPLPHRPGEVPKGKEEGAWSSAHPKGSTIVSPMGKGSRSWFSPRRFGHCLTNLERCQWESKEESGATLFPRARPVPCRWGTGRVQGGVDPRGSAIALPMGFPGARPLPRRWGKKKASRVWLIPKARPLPCRWK
jgi:hypothetical protein